MWCGTCFGEENVALGVTMSHTNEEKYPTGSLRNAVREKNGIMWEKFPNRRGEGV